MGVKLSMLPSAQLERLEKARSGFASPFSKLLLGELPTLCLLMLIVDSPDASWAFKEWTVILEAQSLIDTNST